LGATAVGVLTGSVVGEQLPSAPRQTARDDVSPIPVISAIRFQGNYTISSDRINGEIATRVGQVPDNDKIKADVRNLMKTLWFSDVKTYCQEKPPDSRKYVLTFFLRELPETVPKIEYRGRKSIPLEEIEHMTALKAGQPADRVRTLLGVRQIQRLVYKIKEGGPLFSSKERVRANRGGTREN
jgi:outer membrane protein assembly factor BamA